MTLNENQLSNSKCGREICLEKQDSDFSNFRVMSYLDGKDNGEIVRKSDLIYL